MKKITALVFALIMLFGAAPCFALEEGPKLISDAQVSLKASESPNRLEISFDLTEPVDLSKAASDIIFELLTLDGTETVRYKKDKSWSGYLNSYDDYPKGERKYSSGAENGNYPDMVPDTRIYTSVRSGTSVNVSLIDSVRITVLREDGSGEKLEAEVGGTVTAHETISPIEPETNQNETRGIILDGEGANLPGGTVAVADEVADGAVYDKIKLLLPDAKDFMAIDINLQADGKTVLPDGKVKISIPIPERFSLSDLVVYRIHNDSKISYPVTIAEIGGINYAAFETDHFSVYVLAEIPKAAEESVPDIIIQSERISGSRKENRQTERSYNMEDEREDTIELEMDEVPLSNKIPETGAAKHGAAGVGFALIMLPLIINKRKG